MPIETLYPNGDTTTNWDKAQPGAAHWSGLDEDPTRTPDDGDYIRTVTANDDDRFTFDDTTGMTTETTFQLFVYIRAQINDPAATAKIRLEVIHSGSTSLGTNDVTGADLGGYGKIATVKKSWLSLSLTLAQTDSLELKVTLLAS
jgi:hypothetical protein